MTHTVYYIGGPRDLSKQVEGGDAPCGSLIRVAEEPRINFAINSGYPVSMSMLDSPVHLYRLLPLPLTGREMWRGRIFVAIYEGLE